jgi:acyl-CoA reductase-like NAD-dependent aldehyde dehydrogenase
MVKLDVIRLGSPYDSMESLPVPDVRTGEVRAAMGFANSGLIRRDARKSSLAQQRLRAHSTEDLLARCEQAAVLFAEAALEVGGVSQSPEEYVSAVSATTGIPEPLCQMNVAKIRGACGQVRATIDGLTGGLTAAELDAASERGTGIGRGLAAVLPSNSPGVHSLWLPAIPLKVPLALKPGRSEPWTPYRLRAALLAAGIPTEAISLYPTDHQGATALLESYDRAMVFGQSTTVAAHEKNPRVQVHGPGYSKIVLGADQVDRWEAHLELFVASVLDNSGRSCVNASTLLVPRHGRAIAEGLAQRLGGVGALPLNHPEAKLAAAGSLEAAEAMAAHIADLGSGGATDCSAPYGPAVAQAEGLAFLRPTVLCCANPEHPLAKTEYPFPFVSVVELPEEQMASWIGPTLVLSTITENEALVNQLRGRVDRLHRGVKTTKIDWTKPHQGNLYELLHHATGEG